MRAARGLSRAASGAAWFKPQPSARRAPSHTPPGGPSRRCYNRSTCALRYAASPALMSSAGWPATRQFGGVFESNPYKNPLAGANAAFLASCTSDAYVGDAAASTATLGWCGTARGGCAVAARCRMDVR